MNNEDNVYETLMIECSQCLKEIPASEAQNIESTDYVVHFCGLECYEKWLKKNNQQKTNRPKEA